MEVTWASKGPEAYVSLVLMVNWLLRTGAQKEQDRGFNPLVRALRVEKERTYCEQERKFQAKETPKALSWEHVRGVTKDQWVSTRPWTAN